MRKILIAIILVLFVVSTPFIMLSVIESIKVKPDGKLAELPPVTPPKEPQPTEKPTEKLTEKPAEKKEEEKTASPEFLKGYWDGYIGKKLPILKFSLSDDYRQGHMLGAYDKKHNIKRYTMPKELLKDEPKKDDKKKD